MKLFKHSQGFILSFGFSMENRKPHDRLIAWSDPSTGEWECRNDNQAGWTCFGFVVDPEFVHESDGKVIAYQPGLCIEMIYVGGPTVWNIRTLTSDSNAHRRAA